MGEATPETAQVQDLVNLPDDRATGEASVNSITVPNATTEAISHPTGTVRAELTFISPAETRPMFYSAAYTGGAPRICFATERRSVEIHDMRLLANAPNLDREGFALWHYPTAVDDLYDDDAVRARYYPEIERLLTTVVGASRVVIFDATRRSDAGEGGEKSGGVRTPASRIHVDYTEKSGPQRAKDVLGEDEVTRLMAAGTRIVQINVWRPMRGPVERSPLAVADAGSVHPGQLIATEQVFPDRVGEIYHLAYDPAQRWYYAPRMSTEEVLLIKGWDSLKDGRARFTPHGAFALPDTLDGAPPRESIEVRTFALIEG